MTGVPDHSRETTVGWSIGHLMMLLYCTSV